MKAKAYGICVNENVTVVAVKMTRNTDPIYIHKLANELKILMHLDHPNVISLLGACTRDLSQCTYCRETGIYLQTMKRPTFGKTVIRRRESRRRRRDA